MIPFKLVPACKDYIWGGTLLKKKYNKQSSLHPLAETWELSCHPDGPSVIANGEYTGKTLAEYIEKQGPAVLGTACARFKDFPVMIKFIDAKDNLSVQVHPDDGYAGRVEGGYGKTEMWYVLECEEGASLIYGFKHPVTREEFENRIKDNTLLEIVNTVPVKKGDVFFIEAGTLHAIGKGIVLAEVQQSSNLTYRVYDYGRLGPDGKPRQLHIDKALDVTVLDQPTRPVGAQAGTEKKEGFSMTLLADCQYFHVEQWEVEKSALLEVTPESFCSIICLEGDSTLACNNGDGGKMGITKGDSIFIPAGAGKITIEKPCSLLITTLKHREGSLV